MEVSNVLHFDKHHSNNRSCYDLNDDGDDDNDDDDDDDDDDGDDDDGDDDNDDDDDSIKNYDDVMILQ